MKYLIFILLILIYNNFQHIEQDIKKGHSFEELYDLHYLVREAVDPSIASPLLVLLHGYGSNEKDMFSLAGNIPKNWIVVSIRAPLKVNNNKFKWYNVKLIEEKISLNFLDEEKSRLSILSIIDNISNKYNVDESKVVTAGFSQGANMALGLVLTAPKKILAAGCFSGRFMQEISPLIVPRAKLHSKKVFLSHGAKDAMLPIRYADENQEILESLGIEVSRSIDNIGHTISQKQLSDFVTWLRGV